MLSSTFQLFTFLSVNLIVYTPAVFGQDLSGVPQCALSCLISGYSSGSENCPNASDFACFCRSEDFIRKSRTCYLAACPPESVSMAAAFIAKSCAAVGVNVPAAVPAAVATNPAANPAVTTTTSSPAAPSAQPTVQATATAAITSPTAVASPAPTTVVAPNNASTNVANSTITSNKSLTNKTTSTNTPVIKAGPSTMTNQTQKTNNNTESSGAPVTKVIGLYMMGTTVATLLVL